VIIVGGGPAGLKCAEVLSKSALKVLLLEKNAGFGDKVCAGGLTRKDLEVIDIPDELFEHKILQTAIYSHKGKSGTNSKVPFVFTVDRKELGNWQYQQIANTPIEILNNAKVTEISKNKVVVNGNQAYAYQWLVGADGYNSIVRKSLNIPVEKKLIGLQYQIPQKDVVPRLEIYLQSKYFESWYGWSFPHRSTIAVGCACDPSIMSSKKLKENFHQWLSDKGFDISDADYESAPISYDYRGFKFNNIFLVGDAGGFASGLTGEGILQALVSGETAAQTILNPDYSSERFEMILKYNAVQKKILNLFVKTGRLRKVFHWLIVALLNSGYVKKKIHNSFS